MRVANAFEACMFIIWPVKQNNLERAVLYLAVCTFTANIHHSSIVEAGNKISTFQLQDLGFNSWLCQNLNIICVTLISVKADLAYPPNEVCK